MILLIDNYDSFVHNLARYFQRLGQPTRVVRNDAIDVAGVREARPRAIVFSPGPCTPREAGCTLDVVRALAGQVPMLGVCLGHQAIAAALGARVVRAPQPVHGRASRVHHAGRGVFAGLPNPLVAARYHSLIVDPASLSPELEITARTDDGIMMGMQHRAWPLVGLQFHPESILTEKGLEILANFLELADIRSTPLTAARGELRETPVDTSPFPQVPVTF